MPLTWSLPDDGSGDFSRFYKPSLNSKGEPEKSPEGKPLFRLKAMTDYLIWTTMNVGMGSITKKNWKRFYRRVHILEQVRGPNIMRHNDDGTTTRYWTTPAIIKEHIGLSTNASSMSINQFRKSIYDLMKDDADRNVERATQTDEELMKPPHERSPSKIHWFFGSTPKHNYSGYVVLDQETLRNHPDYIERTFCTTFWDDPSKIELFDDKTTHSEEE